LTHPSLTSNVVVVQSVGLTNKILASKEALGKIFLPVAKEFPNGGDITVDAFFKESEAIGDINVVLFPTDKVGKGDVLMECYPDVKDVPTRTIAVSPMYLFYTRDLTSPTQISYAIFSFMITFLHEAMHLYVPFINIMVGREPSLEIPEQLGKYQIGGVQDATKGDAGYAMEEILFSGTVMGTPRLSFEHLALIQVNDRTQPAEGGNLIKKRLPVYNVDQILKALRAWAFPPWYQCWQKAFPYHVFKAHADFSRLEHIVDETEMPMEADRRRAHDQTYILEEDGFRATNVPGARC